jgi:murein DD-endopeptidase MepM/ murein hydrolase activator NlpD
MKRKLSEHRKKRASSAANHIRDQTQKLSREIMKQKQRQRANASRLQMEHKPDEPQSTLTALQDKKTSFSSKSRLKFKKEELTAPVKASAHTALLTGAVVVHQQMKEDDQENAAVEAVQKSAFPAEGAVHTNGHATSKRKIQRFKQESAKARKFRQNGGQAEKFHFTKSGTTQSNVQREKSFQFSQFIKRNRRKKQVQQGCQAANNGTKIPQTAGEVAGVLLNKLLELVNEKKNAIRVFLGLLLLFLFFMTQFASCGTMIAGAVDAFIQTTWLSDDADITEAEVYYTRLEAQLQQKINQTETAYSGYDEYEYDLDDIGHNPAALISYLSVISENGIFEFNSDTKSKLDDVFEEQYTLTVSTRTETRTHTKTIQVGESLGSVVTSAYCACSICCGQWAGSPTASGVYPTANHTLAVDAYHPIVPLGTKIIINGTLYTVEDTGNLNRYGVDFDVFFDSHSVAQAWGHKTFEAYLYDANGKDSVEVTVTEEITVCTVTLKKKTIDSIAQQYLNLAELTQYYLYKESSGNRAFLSSPVEMDWQDNAVLYGYRCSDSNAVIMHDGLDLELYTGAAVYSVLDGTVTEVGENNTLGKYIVISNEKGYWVKLGHLNALAVAKGQAVSKGELVGQIGRTGNVSRGTLHIEVQYNGAAYDPYFYLQTGMG